MSSAIKPTLDNIDKYEIRFVLEDSKRSTTIKYTVKQKFIETLTLNKSIVVDLMKRNIYSYRPAEIVTTADWMDVLHKM